MVFYVYFVDIELTYFCDKRIFHGFQQNTRSAFHKIRN